MLKSSPKKVASKAADKQSSIRAATKPSNKKLETWEIGRDEFLTNCMNARVGPHNCDVIDTEVNNREGVGYEPEDYQHQFVKGLKEMLKKNVSKESIIDVIIESQLKIMYTMCDIIEGQSAEGRPKWALYIIDKEDKPVHRISTGELSERFWELSSARFNAIEVEKERKSKKVSK